MKAEAKSRGGAGEELMPPVSHGISTTRLLGFHSFFDLFLFRSFLFRSSVSVCVPRVCGTYRVECSSAVRRCATVHSRVAARTSLLRACVARASRSRLRAVDACVAPSAGIGGSTGSFGSSAFSADCNKKKEEEDDDEDEDEEKEGKQQKKRIGEYAEWRVGGWSVPGCAQPWRLPAAAAAATTKRRRRRRRRRRS